MHEFGGEMYPEDSTVEADLTRQTYGDPPVWLTILPGVWGPSVWQIGRGPLSKREVPTKALAI